MNLWKIKNKKSHLHVFISFSSNRNNMACGFLPAPFKLANLEIQNGFLNYIWVSPGIFGNNIALYVGKVCKYSMSTWGFKLILHFSQGKKKGIAQKLFQMWSYVNPSTHSQRCQSCPCNQFQSILGVQHNLHPDCSTFTEAELLFFIIFFPYLETSLPFQSKKELLPKCDGVLSST